MNDAKLQVSPAESENPRAGWRFRCLGQPSLRYDDEPLELTTEPRELALLVFVLARKTRRDSAVSHAELAHLLAIERDAVADRLDRLPSVATADAPVWLDCRRFETLGRRGLEGQRGDPRDLAEAARLYRGDLLEGVELESPAPLADWLADERQRLRGLAIEVLRALIDTYLARGERRLGTRWARRLMAIDPLGEDGHRYLIRCYGETGRRRQAQEQFEELRRLLAERLGCSPSKETRRALAQALEAPEPFDTFAGEPVGPLLPLVGRDAAYHRLESEWLEAVHGCRMSLLSGEPGVGKTRLVRTLLDSLSARSPHRILVARCDGLVQRSYEIFDELLTNGRGDPEGIVETLRSTLAAEARKQAGRLVPELLQRNESPPPILDAKTRQNFFDGLVAALAARASLVDKEQGARSALDSGMPTLVLFVDDLHLADGDTWDFLGHLLARRDLPWWIVATCQPVAAEGLIRHLGPEVRDHVEHLELERIPDRAVEEIAAALVEGEEIPVLEEFLSRRGLGLPVALAEWVNYLWDDRVLLRQEDHWRLDRPMEGLDLGPEAPLEQLVARRIQRLPSSARRLVALAAVIGLRVEQDLLQRIEEEHRTVVELGLQCLVERWILKRHTVRWSSPETWSSGPETGVAYDDEERATAVYEFSHRRIRQAIYHSLIPSRRRILHATVARHLVDLQTAGDPTCCEDLAHHYRAAGSWTEAYPYLRRAARNAVALYAPATARHYFDRTLEAIDHGHAEALAAEAPDEAERWQRRRERVLEERAEFEARLG